MAETPRTVDLVVRNGTVVTVDPDGRVLDADVAVDAGRIVAVAPDLLGSRAVRAARVLDATGAAVIPGLVNAHMHSTLDRGVFEDLPFMTWLEDYALPKDMAYRPDHMRASALLNQAEMIAGGTTACIDIFRHPGVCAEVAEVSGMRITFSPQLIDAPGGPDGPGETLESTLAFIEEWHDRVPDRIRTWFGPHSLYSVKAETFRAIREHADRYGVGIHTHLAESRAETEIVAGRSGGRTPTQWLDELVGLGPDVLVAHAVELDDDDLARLARARVGIGHCPTSNAKLGNRRARIVDLLAAGAVVGLGTDSNMTNNNLDMFEEMRMAALVQKQMLGDPAVLPSAQVLRMATMGSARALGLADDIGSIEVGKAADLAVVDLRGAHARPLVRPIGGNGASNVVEQLVWSCSAADVRHTVVAGATLMEDRCLLTIDLAEAIDLADAAAVDLWRSAGVFERRFGPDRP